MLTAKIVREKLMADMVSVKNGIATIRHSFFYTHGQTAQTWVNEVLDAFPAATIFDSGEVWKPFRGGASVANQSHWFVKFTVPEETKL